VTVWSEVEEALEKIINDYEKVNHVISLFQDDRARLIGLNRGGRSECVALELGSGPGNFSRLLSKFNTGPLVCLDYLPEMHLTSRERNSALNLHYVRAVFEALPIRESSMGLVAAAYALRDSLDKPRAIKEVCNTLKDGGRFLLIDIGKPDNPVIRGFMAVFMKYIVPIMAGLVTSYGYRNPWSKLYLTYEKLPLNSALVSIINDNIRVEDRVEKILGALVIILASK